MKIMLHGVRIELTPSIKEYVSEKVGHIKKMLGDTSEAVEARVEIGRPSEHHHKGSVHYAEINLKAGKMLFRATTEHDDIRTAIDLARDEVERQIQKFKTKKEAARRASRK